MAQRGAHLGTLAETTGAMIRERRESKKLSLSAFGREVGEYLGKPWPKQTVWSIEHGRRPLTVAELIAVAIVLDYPVTYLLAPYPEAAKGDEEIVLSGEWTMTHEELRRTVLGDVGLKAEDALRERLRAAYEEGQAALDRAQEQMLSDWRKAGLLSQSEHKTTRRRGEGKKR